MGATRALSGDNADDLQALIRRGREVALETGRMFKHAVAVVDEAHEDVRPRFAAASV